MTLQLLLAQNGYALLAVGMLLEGETALALAALGAHQGLLDLRVVFAIGAIIAWCSDQTLYWVGRWKGPAVIARWRRLARHAVRARRLIRRHRKTSVIGVRFAYGLRVAGPVLIGASGLPPAQFAVLSAVSAVLWAGVFCALGWAFGLALQRLLQAGHLQWVVGAALAAGTAVAWWLARRRARRQRSRGQRWD